MWKETEFVILIFFLSSFFFSFHSFSAGVSRNGIFFFFVDQYYYDYDYLKDLYGRNAAI